MSLPFEYDRVAVGEFGGTTPTSTDFARARVVILPVPLDRTTSYVAGTRNGPHEILVASSHLELWDEETETDVHRIGILTLPEMELPFGTIDEVIQEIRRVASEIVSRGKFPVVIGGEHSITPPIVAAIAERHPGLSVLQIDAHADLRDHYMGTPHNHACTMRRVLEYAPATQVGIRSLSPEEVAVDARVLRLQHARRCALDGSGRRLVERDGLRDDRRRRLRSGNHARNRHAGAWRPVLVRGPPVAATGDRKKAGGGIRPGGTLTDGRQCRAKLPLREADLQVPVVQVRPGCRRSP
jgi:hypothetical protein